MTDNKRFLNVGGNNKSIALDISFEGWDHCLLDIDKKAGADIVCDARNLTTLPQASFDAVYCAQNLEHYHHHEAEKVLRGFMHILKNDGFVFITVPDMEAIFKEVVQQKLDIDDPLYKTSNDSPILVRDVIYGYGRQIESSGKDYYAHKTGFTVKSLHKILTRAGFAEIHLAKKGWLDISAFAFPAVPDKNTRDYAQAQLFRMQKKEY
jgi:SAM-dependent methyltransferase